MKIVILSPNTDILFSEDMKSAIRACGEVIFVREAQSLMDISELFDDTPKVVAIDPDFCAWQVSREVIEKMKHVQAICLQTTSFSWIDTTAARECGIIVTNLRGFSTEAVAEWAIMMTMNVARKVPLIIKDDWKQDFSKHQGIELRGKTAGIIGLGAIGTRIAEICQGLGMKVIYWSLLSRDPRFSLSTIETVMKSADCIFPTLAYNEDTRGLITDDILKSMKESVILTSIAHKIYNHDLVLQLVKEGKLFGYAFETEEETIFDFDGNVWGGPALAWCTEESLEKNAEQWMSSILQAVNHNYTTRVIF